MKKHARKVLLDDKSLIQQIHAIRVGREDRSLAKTTKDLLRERVTELLKSGDPLAVSVANQRRAS